METALSGKTIVIAGGSSGIGLALATKAAAAGATVHIIGRSSKKLAAAKKEIVGDVTLHTAHIGIEADVAGIVEDIRRVDHLVVTAAELTFKPFLQLTAGDIQGMLASKFWGPVYLVRHFAPLMNKESSVTLYSGSAAHKAVAGASIVAALNAGIEGLARTLALELAPIRVNVVSPGVVESPTWDFVPLKSRAETLKSMGDSLPVGRVGHVDELADSALFLMGSGFTTGAVLQIDGGANA